MDEWCAIKCQHRAHFFVASAEPAREMKIMVDTARMRKLIVKAPTPVEPTSSMLVHAVGARLSAAAPEKQCQPLPLPNHSLHMYQRFACLRVSQGALGMRFAAASRTAPVATERVSLCALSFATIDSSGVHNNHGGSSVHPACSFCSHSFWSHPSSLKCKKNIRLWKNPL